MTLEKQDRFQKLYNMGYDVEKKQQPVIIELDKAMQKYKISSMTLCKKTGISRQTMSAVLNGRMKPGVDFALKVSKVIGVPVEDLFKLNDSAWETLLVEDSQSIYWDLLTQELIKGKDVKGIEEEEGVQYWCVEEDRTMSESEFEKILEKELEERMNEEVEKARQIPVGRRDEKVFQRMARTTIEEDIEKRYPLRFHRVVKSLKPVI